VAPLPAAPGAGAVVAAPVAVAPVAAPLELPLTEAEVREGAALLRAAQAREKEPAWKRMQQARAALPAAAERESVLKALQGHGVLVVSGETGCGKTTQVPAHPPPPDDAGCPMSTRLHACSLQPCASHRCRSSSWTMRSTVGAAA
jgi:hypothetical protein